MSTFPRTRPARAQYQIGSSSFQPPVDVRPRFVHYPISPFPHYPITPFPHYPISPFLHYPIQVSPCPW
jgi:hypothetical protein